MCIKDSVYGLLDNKRVVISFIAATPTRSRSGSDASRARTPSRTMRLSSASKPVMAPASGASSQTLRRYQEDGLPRSRGVDPLLREPDAWGCSKPAGETLDEDVCCASVGRAPSDPVAVRGVGDPTAVGGDLAGVEIVLAAR